jgi:hypothetical protein
LIRLRVFVVPIVVLSALTSSGYRRAPAGFAVGVGTALLYDSSRTESGHPRPIQITTWYPARGTVGTRVTYGDYLDLAASEKSVPTDSATSAGRAAYSAFMRKVGLDSSVVSDWLNTPMRAARGAAPAPGVYPLLILVQGNAQSAVDESNLAEYMASHGYVVATAPSYTRISGSAVDEKSVALGAEEQADDISFVLETVSRRPNVCSGKIGLVAHSLGARGALFFAMRDRRVASLVSLDG